MTPFPLSEGILVYLLGLVVIAATPERFRFGFALAVLPIAVGLLLKTYDAARIDAAQSEAYERDPF